MKATLRHIYLCRTANMSWRTCVVIKQIQSNPFPEWWDNLLLTVQKTARQQHHLCSRDYSDHSGTELLPTHGPSSSRCSSLLWLNILFADNLKLNKPIILLFAISWTYSGYWVTSARVFVSAGYHASVGNERVNQLAKETLDPDRPTGKCPLYRF